eukprot:gene1396-2146_t
MGLVAFQLDTSTPHPGVRIEDDMAVKDTNGGWVTLKATKALSPGNHQWAVKIVDQGDGTDGSGLMVGLLPILTPANAATCLSSKYISEMGGWCISRAGQTYGNWKCSRLSFHAGAVVELDVDFAKECISLSCGREKVVGAIAGLRDVEVYPAVSLYYINQK